MPSDDIRDPHEVNLPELPELPPVVAPRYPERVIPVVEIGEPLEPLIPEIRPFHGYSGEVWPGTTDILFVRSGVNARLKHADAMLPAGFQLVIFDAWRSLTLQRALYERHYAEGSQLQPGYVSNPDDPDRVPPHVTGGAIDITLGWNGYVLKLGTDFDTYDELAWVDALERQPVEPSRSLRRLLTHVLKEQGFCPYPQEWWHFSYGDQIWAFNYGQPAAIYGPIHPPGFIEGAAKRS